jgi:hypothetical protein
MQHECAPDRSEVRPEVLHSIYTSHRAKYEQAAQSDGRAS